MADGSESLFDRLARVSDESLTERVEKVEEFSAEDREIARREREDDYRVGRNLKRIKTVASWASAISLAVVLGVGVLGFCWLFYVVIADSAADVGKSKALLGKGIEWILLVMATLFIQKVFGKK